MRAGFSIVPLRRIARVQNGGTPGPHESNWEGDVPWATPVDLGRVHGGYLQATERSITATGLQSGSTLAPAGSVLISSRAPIGYAAIAGMDTAFNQGCKALIPLPGVSQPRFLKYAVESQMSTLQAAGRGSTFTEVSASDVASLPVPVTSLAKQDRIADYLDRETAEIDKLSAEAKSLIGLAVERGNALAEKLIWGLNVPLIRLKFTADILSGHPFKSAHFCELSEDTTPLLRGINVSPHGVNWDSVVAIPSSEAGEFSDYALQEEDLVLGLDRPIIGSGLRLAKIDKIDAGSLLVQRVARIRSKDPSTSNDWIKAALNSSRFKAHLEPDFTGVSVPHMSPRQLSEFAIPIPPIDVQNEILSQVHAEEIAVRSSIHDLQTLVTMLNERRGALISAAVTGQIDVTAQGESATEQLQDELEVPL